MNQENYDQIRLSDEIVGDAMKYLLPETSSTSTSTRGTPSPSSFRRRSLSRSSRRTPG